MFLTSDSGWKDADIRRLFVCPDSFLLYLVYHIYFGLYTAKIRFFGIIPRSLRQQIGHAVQRHTQGGGIMQQCGSCRGQDAKGSRGDGGAFVVSDHHDDLAVYFLLSLTVPIRRLLIIINFPDFLSAASSMPDRFPD